MQQRGAYSVGRRDWATWPRYDAAVLGLRNYWYPVLWSRELRDRPVPLTVLGEKVMLMRDRGRAVALHDRCPHRGIPLSFGRQEWPGTLSCVYHGWTFDVRTGELVVVLTDGPDSPICGKVAVRTYPVEERIGLVWIYMGDGDAPPVEDDIPRELIENEIAKEGRLRIRPGNWRLAAENGFDDGHAKYLHRETLWTTTRLMPVWSEIRTLPIEDGWITNVVQKIEFRSRFPEPYGEWPPPRKRWYKRVSKKAPRISIRMPTMLRVEWPRFTHYEWYVPVDAENHRYLQFIVKFPKGGRIRRALDRFQFKLQYYAYIRPLFHGRFNDQDLLMVKNMDAPPERLYRPDASIIGWRNLVQAETRGVPVGADGPIENGDGSADGHAVETPESEPISALGR
jgi:phenylpropionate dioxygenase-like ring-hydroxylating dioxygenase large terminal subunit